MFLRHKKKEPPFCASTEELLKHERRFLYLIGCKEPIYIIIDHTISNVKYLTTHHPVMPEYPYVVYQSSVYVLQPADRCVDRDVSQQ